MRREENLDKYEENVGFIVLPKGNYYVEIYKVADQKSRATGNDMVLVTYSVLNEEYKNTKLFEYLTFSEKAMGRVKHFLHMIGEPYQGNCQIDSGNWIGKCLKIVVSVENHETYGEQNKVTAHFPFEPAQEEAYKEDKKVKSRDNYQANKQTAKETKDQKRDRQEHEFANEQAAKNKDEDIPF